MPKHTPFTLALARKNARSRPPLETAEIDPYQLARDRKLRQGAKDWRSERSPSAFAVCAPPKPKGSEPKRPPMDRWGEIVGRHDESARRPMGTRSAEIKPPVVRSFTGGKAENAEGAERRANNMRDAIADQASRATRWNMALSGLVTTKLGDGKGGI